MAITAQIASLRHDLRDHWRGLADSSSGVPDSRSWRRHSLALLERYDSATARGRDLGDLDVLAGALTEALAGELTPGTRDAVAAALAPVVPRSTDPLDVLAASVPARTQMALRRQRGRTARELACYEVLAQVGAEALALSPGRDLTPAVVNALRATLVEATGALPLAEEESAVPWLDPADVEPTPAHVRAVLLTADVAGPLYRTYVRLEPLTVRSLRDGGLPALRSTITRREHRFPGTHHLADLSSVHLGVLVAFGMELDWRSMALASYEVTLKALDRNETQVARTAWRHCVFHLSQLPHPHLDHVVAELALAPHPAVDGHVSALRRALRGRSPHRDPLAA